MRKIIEGNVYLHNLYLTELFDLSDVEVSGDFYCMHNDLDSLEGGPQIVGGDFYFSYNNLTSLRGAPQHVGGSFNCERNPLTSLEGIPKIIGGSFYIDEVLKDRFPEEYIRSLCKIKGKVVYA